MHPNTFSNFLREVFLLPLLVLVLTSSPPAATAFYESSLQNRSCLSSSSSCAATAYAATSTASDQDSPSLSPHESLQLDVERLRKAIRSGHVYQQHNFLSPEQVKAVRNEINDLKEKGAFAPSGLSNTAQKEQGFDGKRDRSICAVPWWAESLTADTSTKAGTSDDGDGGSATTATALVQRTVAPKLQQLRLALADVLYRPTMNDPSMAHECYYSVASVGSSLPRHMDERHEELKGAKGWLLPSRRSLSWLVYLSDDGWTLDENGGALRYYPQEEIAAAAAAAAASTSTHDGNLQIGWLLSGDDKKPSDPVYLDSWVKINRGKELGCILYRVNDDDPSERFFLTKPWLVETVAGSSVAEYLKEAAETGKDNIFLNREEASRFVLLEDRVQWDSGMIPKGSVPHDINPARGSLVVFDSVMVPHQVEPIRSGARIALAGWFHEATQGMPVDITLS